MQTHRHQDESEKVISKIIDYARQRLSTGQVQLITEYLRLFYANVAADDLKQRNLVDLYGAALSQCELMQERKPGEVKLNIINPHFEYDGWQSTHTIVQIVMDDMPFLVGSIRMEIIRLGFTSHLIIHLGGLRILRDNKRNVTEVLPYNEEVKSERNEAHIYIEIDRQTDSKILMQLKDNLFRVIGDIEIAVTDWRVMRQEIFKAIEEIEHSNIPISKTEIEESIAFLRWIANDNFTFLGCRDYEFIKHNQEEALKIIPGSGFGVLRDDANSKITRYYSDLPNEARKLALSKHILIISKTNTRATVHRHSYTDYIGIKRFNKDGEILGERRFIGLYTSSAYNSNPRSVPIIRKKVEKVLQRSGLPQGGHAAKALLNILETLPRDDLFQANTNELFELTMDIFQLQQRRRIRLFVRKDAYGRFISCLVYVPRENFNTELLNRMQMILQEAFNGLETSFETYFAESVLARIHFTIRIDPKNQPEYDEKEIESKLMEVGKSWRDGLQESLLDYFGEERGNMLTNKYKRAFPAGYREVFTPSSSVYDIEHIERLSEKDELEMSFYRRLGSTGNMIQFKTYNRGCTVPLSDALPMLENLGLRVIGEVPYKIMFRDANEVWINDFNMSYPKATSLSVEKSKEIFQEAFYHIWNGDAENDGFNNLVLGAQLNWREITLLRAYAKYFRQIGFTFSQQYIEETLSSNPQVAELLIELFHYRFNPDIEKTDELEKKILNKIKVALDNVANLDEDRILRRYTDVILGTVRTNFYQTKKNNIPKSYIAFKFLPEKIPNLPLPLPKYEIFVYSPRFEGIHLRAAKTARGGLRWSDRREDFRTEILGLMKAQQVKNAIIVPSGAKGGFVPKKLPEGGSREKIIAEAVECYKAFIHGLLDLTDNIINKKLIKPKNTYCYDSDDTYLVVAADKGTATFSDIANSISIAHEFWLGDAFASGGSTGYDHKKMGITARGAWESVKYHFQELGLNVQIDYFTVIGIGDMAGDVFGNSMLLSEHIKLVAAFNHQHIFIDPDPDTKKCFKERKRLFQLPRSSWEDYDKNIISKGGGVFKRSAKSIKLSPEIKASFGIKRDAIIPNELIHELLKAKVDLLWNGGIGTFVKASTEENNDVGDRSNDDIRVDANELRCRVVAEGGNLGFTQLARIEFELNKGIINTDFIDNSAGVDCSDHEVNIKILLNEIVSNGDMTEKQRNKLLVEMTDEVGKLVLENNYKQTRAIGLIVLRSHDYINLYNRYIQDKEAAGQINRELEFLPDEKTITERKAANIGFTRPEVAVLFAYSKIILEENLIKTSLPEDPYMTNFIESPFPKLFWQKFKSQLKKHRLSREIIVTQLSNSIVNDMGMGFVYQLKDETRASTDDVARAYIIAREVFKLSEFHQVIKELDYKISADIQKHMMQKMIQLIRRSTRWFLRNQPNLLNIKQLINNFSEKIDELTVKLPKLLLGVEKEKYAKEVKDLIEAKVPDEIAKRVASTDVLYATLNIVEAATKYKADIKNIALIYFAVADRLKLPQFRDEINKYVVENRWTVLARSAYKGDLDWQQRALTIGVFKFAKQHRSVRKCIEVWVDKHKRLVERWEALLADLRSNDIIEFAMLSVAMRELYDLAQASLLIEVKKSEESGK